MSQNDKREPAIAYNSIDFIKEVDRLPVGRSMAKGIYLYGLDNNYPYKVKQLAYRSGSLMTAINTKAKFLRGQRFEGATANDVKKGTDVIVNEYKNISAFDLINFITLEKSMINFAIHVNYNQLGEAVAFTPIPYEFCRIKIMTDKDLFQKMIISNIWNSEFMNNINFGFFGASKIMEFNEWINSSKRGKTNVALECFSYNPDPYIVREQISLSGGIENYSGQLYYCSDYTAEYYQRAVFDPVLDDSQIEAEAKLFSLSNMQNQFSASGIIKYPSNLDSKNEKEDIKAKMRNISGSINQGRFITIPYTPASPPTTAFFEPIMQNNIDKMFVNQLTMSKDNIYQFYQQPDSINGRSKDGMFNTEQIEQGFIFYNSVTEDDRQQIEYQLTNLFANSIIDIKLPIEIKPLEYGSQLKRNINESNNQSDETISNN